MTMAQLARRIGVKQPRVSEIEKAEMSGRITLDSLERTAQALDCRLVYALVPRTALEDLVEERALKVAHRQVKVTAHSMALEAQSVDKEEEQEQIRQLAKKLLEQPGSTLWEDE